MRETTAAAVVAAVPGKSQDEVRVRPVDMGRMRGRPESEGRPRQPWSRPLWIIALCCLAAALRFGRAALIPLALALLVACVLSGAVEALKRMHIPRPVSAGILLVLLAGALGGVVDAVATPAQQWMQNAPHILRTIEHRVRPAQTVLRKVDDIAKRAESLATSGTTALSAAAPPPTAAVSDWLTPIDIFAATGAALVAIMTVLAFAFLILSSGPSTLARITCALASDWHAIHALRMIESVRKDVGRYYGTLLLINVLYGSVIAGAMWLLDMPNPPLWGVLAAILNFVPYVGPAVTVAILTVVALVTFPSNTHVLLVAASFLGLATIEGHVVEPVFLGRRLNLNPILVLLALWIGGWLWGIAGVVVALPVLLAIKVTARLASQPAR
jgi:predicted PurR-regulated permease PerM